MRFTLLDKKKELISTITDSVANGTGKDTVYTVLIVNNRVIKDYQVKSNMQWLYPFCLIIDEISIIDLSLLEWLYT